MLLRRGRGRRAGVGRRIDRLNGRGRQHRPQLIVEIAVEHDVGVRQIRQIGPQARFQAHLGALAQLIPRKG